jgi:hypothetical protein
MDPNPEQPAEAAAGFDSRDQDLARRLDHYFETHFQSIRLPSHIRLLIAERINRLTGTLDQHGATVSVMAALPQVRHMLAEAFVTGYTLARLEQRFLLEEHLLATEDHPADEDTGEADAAAHPAEPGDPGQG